MTTEQDFASTLDASTRQLPLVTVAIPAFNACETLCAAIDSVLAQTYPNIEIIVVDDGSTDDTRRVLLAYGDRLQYHYQPNGGLAKARNEGVSRARGAFIVLMDADDVCMPERISVQLAVMRSIPGAALCGSDFSTFDKNGPIAAQGASWYYSKVREASKGYASLYPDQHTLVVDDGFGGKIEVEVFAGDVALELCSGNFVHPPTVMFKRELFGGCGPFDEALRNHSDWEWITRAGAAGKFVHINRPLLNYRISPTQKSSPQRRIERAVDLVQVAKNVSFRHANIPHSFRVKIDDGLMEMQLDAADALAEVQKQKAGQLFFQGLRWQDLVSSRIYAIALKIILPAGFIRIIRKARGHIS